MSEGDTPAEPTGLENAYGEFFQPDTEESPATEETAKETGSDEEETEDSPSEKADTSKADTAKTGWEGRYQELQQAYGKQGNELGQLRKELAELKSNLEKQQPKQDPLEKYPALKALDPDKRDFALQTSSAALERLLGDHGLTIDDLVQAKRTADYTSQQMSQEYLNREISAIRQEFGEDTFSKYLPNLQAVAEKHPTLSPREAWDMVTAADTRKSQAERAKAMEKERKERAKSADFGNERPAKPLSNRLSQDDIQKLSANGSGKPSPRFKALYKEAMRELGG